MIVHPQLGHFYDFHTKWKHWKMRKKECKSYGWEEELWKAIFWTQHSYSTHERQLQLHIQDQSLSLQHLCERSGIAALTPVIPAPWRTDWSMAGLATFSCNLTLSRRLFLQGIMWRVTTTRRPSLTSTCRHLYTCVRVTHNTHRTIFRERAIPLETKMFFKQ